MTRPPFIDTHVHFWDLKRPELRYAFLEPDAIHPVMGNIDEIKIPLYDAEQFLTETSGSGVAKIVHVQAALGIEDPVDETRWLEGQAQRTGVPAAIVAHVDLRADDVEAQFERHRAVSSRVCGVRDFGEGDYLVDPAFARGFAALGEHGLVCDLDCVWEDMGKARDLAQRHPQTTVVLDHAGFPRERTPEYFANWKRGLETLASADSVVCKISGLGMCDPHWTVDSIRPWFETCLEAFGVQRCVLATNWPIDRMFSDYETVVDAYWQIISGCSRDEQVALFSGNAERVFQLTAEA